MITLRGVHKWYGKLHVLRGVDLVIGQGEVVVPPLGNELIALLKDSSLVSIIAVTDLMRAGREITGRTPHPFETYMLVALLYLCMTLPLTLLVRAMERRMKTG